MNILIAEDNRVLNDFYSTILGKYGIVDKVSNGKEAIEIYEKAVSNEIFYDIIFLDIMMPEATGIDVLEHIRFTEEEMGLERAYIIMITALKNIDTIGEAIKNMADKFLIKPTYIEKLREIIEQVKEKRAGRG